MGEIALELVPTDNPWTRADIVRVCLGVPLETVVQIVPTVAQWLSSGCPLMMPEITARVAHRLMQGGEHASAIVLLTALLDTAAAASDNHRGEVEVSSRYDGFEFERVVSEVVPEIVAAGGLAVASVVCEALDRAVKLRASGGDGHDDGCAFRSAIEEHAQNLPISQEAICLLIKAARDAAERLAEADKMQVPAIIRELERHEPLVFRRLALYLLHKYPTSDPAALRRYLVEGAIESVPLRHERWLLARHGYRHLEPADQERLVERLWAGPEDLQGADADDQRRLDQWRVYYLAPIAEQLVGERLANYGRLVEEFGEPQHPDFSTYIQQGWVGPTSPRSHGELAAMTIDELVVYLSTWSPSGQFMTPSREGAGRSLAKVVAGDPQRFLESWERLGELHRTYVCAIIEGATEALNAGKPIAWRHALGLCAWVVAQPSAPEVPERDAIERDEDPGWSWSRKAVARLIKAGLADGPASTPLPIELATVAWGIIENLVERPEPDDNGWGGALDQALNTLHGVAVHTALAYAVWRLGPKHGSGEPAPCAGLSSAPEIAALLERHLDPARDPSRATRALFGEYLPVLSWIDRRWVLDHLPFFFPTNPSQREAREITWTVFVEHTNTCLPILELVRPQFERSLVSLGEGDGTSGRRKGLAAGIVRHLGGYYMLGGLPLQDGLLDAFYGKANAKLRGGLIEDVGFAFFHAREVDAEVVRRAQELWLHRFAATEAGPGAERQAELAPFGWWFASGKFEDVWALEQLRRASGCRDPPRHGPRGGRSARQARDRGASARDRVPGSNARRRGRRGAVSEHALPRGNHRCAQGHLETRGAQGLRGRARHLQPLGRAREGRLHCDAVRAIGRPVRGPCVRKVTAEPHPFGVIPALSSRPGDRAGSGRIWRKWSAVRLAARRPADLRRP